MGRKEDIVKQLQKEISDSVSGKDSITPSTYQSPFKKALQLFSNELANQLKAQLKKYLVKSQPSELGQSLTVAPIKEISDSVVTTSILAAYYWRFINYGVDGRIKKYGSPYKYKPSYSYKPAYSHAEAIKEWVPTTGFKPTLTYSVKTKKPIKWTYDSWAFVIARNIKERGLKPKPFVDDVVDNPLILEEIGGVAFSILDKQIDVIVIDIEKELNKNG
jgi:hypothetical protein